MLALYIGKQSKSYQAFQIDIYNIYIFIYIFIYLHTLAQIRPPMLQDYSPHAKALGNYLPHAKALGNWL